MIGALAFFSGCASSASAALSVTSRFIAPMSLSRVSAVFSSSETVSLISNIFLHPFVILILLDVVAVVYVATVWAFVYARILSEDHVCIADFSAEAFWLLCSMCVYPLSIEFITVYYCLSALANGLQTADKQIVMQKK